MTNNYAINLVGYRCGIGAGNHGCADAWDHLRQSPYLAELNWLHWHRAVSCHEHADSNVDELARVNAELAQTTKKLVEQDESFIVIGGDHSCAIGTWSGVWQGLKNIQPGASLGLLWIDAHLDSHTPQTTPSGNIHGMPLACLLGYGDSRLTNIGSAQPKLLPQNVRLIGARSYESEEHDLLKKLHVTINYMETIQDKTFDKILANSVQNISKNADYFGVSLDLDGITPDHAPAVGTPEANGIDGGALCEAFKRHLAHHPQLIGTEIVEYNPHLDRDQRTEKLIARIISNIYPEGPS